MTYDPHPTRNLVPVKSLNKFSGIKLEDIPPGDNIPGYVICYREWPNDQFLLKRREGLSKDEIFRLVDILLEEQNIRPNKGPHPLD